MCVLLWFFGFVAYHTSQLLENALFFAQAGLRGISRENKSKIRMGVMETTFLAVNNKQYMSSATN